AWRASPCATAAAGSRKRPPSENESGVTFRTPITRTRSLSSNTRSLHRQRIESSPLPLERLVQPTDLGRVVVRMRGVDLEPILGGVAPGLGVPTLALPVLRGHRGEELARGGARGAKRLERRPVVALVVAEPGRVGLLVVALNDGLGLGQELPEALSRDRFA